MSKAITLNLTRGQVGWNPTGWVCTADDYDGAIDSNCPIGIGYDPREAIDDWLDDAELKHDNLEKYCETR